MRPSLQSKIFFWILKVINFKKIIEKRSSKELLSRKKGFVSQRIKRSYLLNIQSFNDKQIATFESKGKVSKNHILFFHGGAYIFEASVWHWRLAEKIVKNSHCRMTLIDYPLAPEHNYKETFTLISGSYDKLLNNYPEDNIILMGDSAGGGLALAFIQKLIKEKHTRLPVKIILLSPWLDMQMLTSNVKNQESLDHILTVKMLRNAGKKYSNGDNMDQYLLSPINGELKDIPETIVFFGTEELFYSDCKRLTSITAFKNKNILFKEYQKMQHDWALFPIPESKQVVSEIGEFIKEK